MFGWLRRRRLSADARRKLLILQARAEEAVISTHVDNLFELLRALRGEVDLDRGIELYVEAMGLDESAATTVTNRLLARLGGSPRDAGDRPRRFQRVFESDES
jgi:hypothetical protein